MSPGKVHKELRLIHSGDEYFDELKDAIDRARHEIYLQAYIFRKDLAGEMIAEALIGAARRGIKVYLLLDSYGSSPMPESYEKYLRDNGVDLRFFAPLFSWNSLYIGRRLHHKAFVADDELAIIGGINISDHYKGTTTEKAWLDYAVEIKGPAVHVIKSVCKSLHFKRRLKGPHQAQHPDIKIIRNDWLKRKNDIYKSYLHHIKSAEKELIILGSYFLPGRRLSNALINASKKCVKVKIIVSGVSDVPFIRAATRYLYNRFLHSGLEIYEWPESVLHGKAAIADKSWCTIGSFNLNNLSSYGSLEMNAEISDKDFVSVFHEDLELVLSSCRRIDIRKAHGPLEKASYWFSYAFISSVSSFMTFFTYRRFFKHFRVD